MLVLTESSVCNKLAKFREGFKRAQDNMERVQQSMREDNLEQQRRSMQPEDDYLPNSLLQTTSKYTPAEAARLVSQFQARQAAFMQKLEKRSGTNSDPSRPTSQGTSFVQTGASATTPTALERWGMGAGQDTPQVVDMELQ